MNGRPTPALYLAGALFFAVVMVGAYVALTLHGDDTGGLITLGSPILAALLLSSQVQSASKDQKATQEETLGVVAEIKDTAEKVQRQTNGMLDTRIRALVREAYTESMQQLGVADPPEVLPMRRESDRTRRTDQEERPT